VAYNYWAILGLDMLAIVFWITAFALLASEVAPFGSSSSIFAPITIPTCIYRVFGFCVKNKRHLSLATRSFSAITYRNAMDAAAGLGGLEL
jgi:hypothetical protein